MRSLSVIHLGLPGGAWAGEDASMAQGLRKQRPRAWASMSPEQDDHAGVVTP